MKKVVLIFAVMATVIVSKVSAQTAAAGTTVPPTGLRYELENVMISSLKLNEGSNTVPVPNRRGTIKFVKRGNIYTDVMFLDSLGITTRLQSATAGTNGAPKPECKTTLPDACFGTANKNIGLCICKPGSLSNGTETYSIGLLLPAVQKVREAAARRQ